jgi:hypothetical protein
MKNLIFISAIFIMGLISCNSGTGNTSSGKDSTNSVADTTHSAMSTSMIEALPPIPEGAKVFFKNLKDGQTVADPVKVEMGATNISVDSAGTVQINSGHFHLLIDDGDSTASGVVVPKDSTHLHFGNAQKETTLTLSPGKHKIALQFADGIHRSYGSKLSEVITINVKK